MRVLFVASDGKEFNTEDDCLQYEQSSLSFRAYDREGRPTEVGHGVHLLHIIDEDEGGEAFQRLCEKENEDSGDIGYRSGEGWYWWDDFRFSPVDEELVRAMARACYNVDIAD